MRHVRAIGILLALILAPLPLAVADTVQDEGVGLNLALFMPGIWDAFEFATPGGSVTITLDWDEPGTFPFADYDLRLYRPGALANNELSDNELLAESSQHPYEHQAERLDVVLSAATYVVVVAPFQAQMETYTLWADPGTFGDHATLTGIQYYSS